MDWETLTRRELYVLAFGLGLAVSTCCKPPETPPPPLPIPSSDAGTEDPILDAGTEDPILDAASDQREDAHSPPQAWDDGDPCLSRWNLQVAVGCPPMLNPTDGGLDAASDQREDAQSSPQVWVLVCRNARQNGLQFGLEKVKRACLSRAATKADVRACGVECP